MYFQDVVCGTCGYGERRPHGAPLDSAAPMTRTQLREYLKGAHDWPHGGSAREFSAEEAARIPQMFGRCGCGGNFYPPAATSALEPDVRSAGAPTSSAAQMSAFLTEGPPCFEGIVEWGRLR